MENSKIQSSFRSAYLTGHKWFAEVIKGASLEASKHSPREVSLIKPDFVIRWNNLNEFVFNNKLTSENASFLLNLAGPN